VASSRRTSTQASWRGLGADAGDLAGTVTTRSTTWTALPPDAAARDCSHARCRQVAEHHFGIGPRDRGVIAPWHHPHVVAAARRPAPRDLPSVGAMSRGGGCRALDRCCCCCCCC
jgi:hypothetical protein